tara:strand:+ start:944 stop:1081 length:138 start_codon:yes stop_codon:yes gene_type:complete
MNKVAVICGIEIRGIGDITLASVAILPIHKDVVVENASNEIGVVR